jgi:hypothetical protein
VARKKKELPTLALESLMTILKLSRFFEAARSDVAKNRSCSNSNRENKLSFFKLLKYIQSLQTFLAFLCSLKSLLVTPLVQKTMFVEEFQIVR